MPLHESPCCMAGQCYNLPKAVLLIWGRTHCIFANEVTHRKRRCCCSFLFDSEKRGVACGCSTAFVSCMILASQSTPHLGAIMQASKDSREPLRWTRNATSFKANIPSNSCGLLCDPRLTSTDVVDYLQYVYLITISVMSSSVLLILANRAVAI